MQDEARNTEHQHISHPDLKLRHARVAFVSVGQSDHHNESVVFAQDPNNQESELLSHTSTDLQTPHDVLMAALSLEDSNSPLGGFSALESKGEVQNSFLYFHRKELEEDVISVKMADDFFFTDLNGAQQNIPTGSSKSTVRRSPSPSQSDSSEEVIIFSGRKRLEFEPSSNFATDPILPSNPVSPLKTVGQFDISHSLLKSVINDSVSNSLSELPLFPAIEPQTTMELDHNRPPVSDSFKPKKQKKPRNCGWRRDSKNDSLADYISNVKSGEDNECLTGGTLLPICGDIMERTPLLNEPKITSVERNENFSLEDSKAWNSADLHDLDDFSTSSDDSIFVTQVLSKRRRRSGIQYLVVGENQSVDEARWMPIKSLRMPSAFEQVQLFEANQHKLSSNESDDVHTVNGKLALNRQHDFGDFEDDQDLLNGTLAQMTDEKIAKLLSKQEELGLGSSDIVLFDGDGFENVGHSTPSLDERHRHMSRSKYEKLKEPCDDFSSIDALESAIELGRYNGFDVIDRSRPSLWKPYKGYRIIPALEPSDLDMVNSIQAVWENDRAKKKTQKHEREKLHQLGLIGKKSKMAIKAQSINDISIAKLKKEIKEFLNSPAER